RILGAIVFALAIHGIASAQDTLMTPDEIKTQWIGKKLFARSGTAGLIDFTMRADGSADVSGNNLADTGTWRLSSDGYCATWKKIRAGQERCFTVVKKGAVATVLNPDKSVSAEILRVSD
ncbi:MAG TPA: hypothetical protein VK996_17470, partial [Ramlibacter sp.]|nr:hypothetical protein [Ramlibacter sp.]